ncbi:MAG: LysR family transcriptional regulator [Labrenzia sp.]
MALLANLSMRQLMTFREVMRTNSITEASRALGRTQPAVSSMILNLEEQLNLPLFVRERGRLVPTPEAHYFLEEANDVLERLERTARTMSEFSAQDRGNLRIACYPAGSSYFLPSVLSEFLMGRPHVTADFMMRASETVEDLIASQEYDIGLAETPPPRGSIKIETFEFRCFVALPEMDGLAKNTSIHVRELRSHQMAGLYDDHVLTMKVQDLFKKCGVPFNRRFSLRTFLPAIQMVSSGLCAAIVDGVTATSTPAPGVVFKPLKPSIKSSISILLPAHRPTSILTKAFEATLRTRIEKICNESPS